MLIAFFSEVSVFEGSVRTILALIEVTTVEHNNDIIIIILLEDSVAQRDYRVTCFLTLSMQSETIYIADLILILIAVF